MAGGLKRQMRVRYGRWSLHFPLLHDDGGRLEKTYKTKCMLYKVFSLCAAFMFRYSVVRLLQQFKMQNAAVRFYELIFLKPYI